MREIVIRGKVGNILQAENRVYGHARVLARYAGLEGEPWIAGALQHGWNPFDGIGAFDGLWRTSVPKLTWSESAAERGRELGGVGYTPIGAPWLYLLRQFPAMKALPAAESTLVYPHHTTVHDELVGDHAAFARDLAQCEMGTPVTVCLHPVDFAHASSRAAYEDVGFPVICHGGSSAFDPHHTGFLDRQLQEMSRHSRVVSNRLSTAVLYAAAAGREVGVYGPDMSTAGQRSYAQTEIPAVWPALHSHRVSAADARHTASVELGEASLRDPEELREILGWSTQHGLSKAHAARFTMRRIVDLARVNGVRRRRGERGFRAY